MPLGSLQIFFIIFLILMSLVALFFDAKYYAQLKNTAIGSVQHTNHVGKLSVSESIALHDRIYCSCMRMFFFIFTIVLFLSLLSLHAFGYYANFRIIPIEYINGIWAFSFLGNFALCVFYSSGQHSINSKLANLSYFSNESDYELICKIKSEMFQHRIILSLIFLLSLLLIITSIA